MIRLFCLPGAPVTITQFSSRSLESDSYGWLLCLHDQSLVKILASEFQMGFPGQKSWCIFVTAFQGWRERCLRGLFRESKRSLHVDLDTRHWYVFFPLLIWLCILSCNKSWPWVNYMLSPLSPYREAQYFWLWGCWKCQKWFHKEWHNCWQRNIKMPSVSYEQSGLETSRKDYGVWKSQGGIICPKLVFTWKYLIVEKSRGYSQVGIL